MRLEIGRLLAGALVSLMLAGTSACGESAPEAPAGPAASTGAGDLKKACDLVMKARNTALDAFAPVSASLAETGISADGIGKATEDLRAAFTAMHLDVAAAAEQASDPHLKAKIATYQISVEQAIVALEASDGDRTKLAATMELPELRSAEKAIMDTCA